MKYKIIVDIDTKKLRKETQNKKDSIDWLIKNEMGWVNTSGIETLSITKLK